jgi:hypothetical protein
VVAVVVVVVVALERARSKLILLTSTSEGSAIDDMHNDNPNGQRSGRLLSLLPLLFPFHHRALSGGDISSTSLHFGEKAGS